MPYELPSDFQELHQNFKLKMAAVYAPPKPSLLNRLVNAVQVPFRVAAGNPNADHQLAIDTSHYQPNVDYEFLQPYLGWVYSKAYEVQEEADESYWYDNTFHVHCQGWYDANNKLGGRRTQFGSYIFLNPYAIIAQAGQGVGLNALVDFNDHPEQNQELMGYIKAVTGKAVDFHVLDIERWWGSYTKYLALLRGEITQAEVPVIPAPWWGAEVRVFTNGLLWAMKKGLLPMKPIFWYSAEWFVKGFMASEWPNQAKSFEGADVRFIYARYTTPGEITTWEDLRAAHLPDTSTTKPYYGDMVDMPFGVQFGGGNTKLPNGKYGNNGFDVNVSLWSNTRFDTWLDVKGYEPPPPPTTTYTLSGSVIPAMAGVTIGLGTLSTSTGTQGQFTLTNVPAGMTGSLTPSMTGYTFQPVTIPVNVNSNMTGLNFEATANPAPPQGDWQQWVTDRLNSIASEQDRQGMVIDEIRSIFK
jgi:hypothetical protein